MAASTIAGINMRLFGVTDDNKFIEHDFQAEHREKLLEDWLEQNPNGIVEGQKLFVIGRQVTTNLGSTIDLLALDRQGDAVVVELKRGRTPRDVLAQALEYASFVEGLGYDGLEQILRKYLDEGGAVLSEMHAAEFEVGEGQAVAFNKAQHIVIVGSEITPEIRQTSAFLRKRCLDVTCVEFGFFSRSRSAARSSRCAHRAPMPCASRPEASPTSSRW
ncbi:MAG TPA: endonuclease NucS, partial [Polyangiaceae bacterium]|nr:endonuclease NucS [Polyangiaceae bacterium]